MRKFEKSAVQVNAKCAFGELQVGSTHVHRSESPWLAVSICGYALGMLSFQTQSTILSSPATTDLVHILHSVLQTKLD